MEVQFRTKKLQRQYEHSEVAIKAFGATIARKYVLRINTIKSARDIDELRALPVLRCHPLKGNRQGQWAMNLTGFFRLIFSLKGNKLEIAFIEEVSKHYDS